MDYHLIQGRVVKLLSSACCGNRLKLWSCRPPECGGEGRGGIKDTTIFRYEPVIVGGYISKLGHQTLKEKQVTNYLQSVKLTKATSMMLSSAKKHVLVFGTF